MAIWPFQKRHPRTITAAAVDLIDEGPAPYRARTGEDSWQKEAWRHYDICGELRYATGWISNAIGLADLYAAEVDPQTGLVTGPTDNRQVQAVAATVLGGPSKRPQAQSTLATNWQVAGESFIIVRPTRPGMPDEWIVLSSTEIEERSGAFRYADPITGKKLNLTARDKLIRHWNPHPSRQIHADSAVRSALPILLEIERTSQNIAARLVSRIASNGVWLLPQEIDFPHSDKDATGPQGVMDWLARAGEAAMQDIGQASSQMPLVLQMPGELIQAAADGRVDFASELSAEVLDLRSAALKRLATSLDMPAEIVTGMGESNHWSAWQVEESAYKIHVAPVLDRLSEALTGYYLHPVLAAMGVPDPGRYVLAFDTTEIITRPNRTEELVTLYDKRLISDDFLRTEAGIPESAVPSEEERTRRLFEELVRADTGLLADPAVRECLDVDCAMEPTGGGAPALPPAAPEAPRELPARPSPGEESPQPDAGLVAAAELIVFDALSRAGGRLLTREFRGQFADVAKHDLHTVIPVNTKTTDQLLEGSFQFSDSIADTFALDRASLRSSLLTYCRIAIDGGHAHKRSALTRILRAVSPRG